MQKEVIAFLEKLLETPSPSGFEQPAARLFRDRVTGYADEVTHDVHGNSYAILNPDADFTFMLAAHVDEIGLMVTHINDDGFLYVGQIGGIEVATLVGQRVAVYHGKQKVTGVVGRKCIMQMTPKERTEEITWKDIWVDIGAKNKKDAEKVVSVGDPIVVDVKCIRLLNDNIASRACDDKVGVFIIAEVIRKLAKKKLNISVVGVATVQEELGMRGSMTASYGINPDAGIAFDPVCATDHPEVHPRKNGEIRVGDGPCIQRGGNINLVLESELRETAKQLKIPLQISASPDLTGTDANPMQVARGGTATAVIRIADRYMHIPAEVVSLKDLDNAIKLVSAFLAKHPPFRDYRP